MSTEIPNQPKRCRGVVRLNDPQLLRSLSYVGGKWVGGMDGGNLLVTNPATQESLGHITLLNRKQIQAAIEAADEALAAWRAWTVDERGGLLIRWHDLILENKEDLARLIVLEQGKTIDEARGEIEYGASFVRWFAEEGRRANGETIPSHIPNAQLGTIREPVGVVALITPWNFPHAMITRKAAAALAIGCTVIVKPAEETPYSALALAELAERAGFPSGVFNVVIADPKLASCVICESNEVKALSFTGSTRVGRLLLKQAAATVKKCSMELGGNAPFIVLPNTDVVTAARAAAEAKFQSSGQDCLAANRIFVPREQCPLFLETFEVEMRKLKLGNGMDEEVDLGPLIGGRAVKRAQSLVDDAIAKGARMIGGDQSKRPGSNYFVPTLLVGVTPEMNVYREENFCPVAGVISYDSLDELLSMVNDTSSGLAAYVYGHDIRQIWQLIRALEFGMVSVNSVKMTGHSVPFGGMKQSGLGREGSSYGIDEFSEIKYYCLGDLNTVSGS